MKGLSFCWTMVSRYDHNMSHHDCQAYYLRAGDSWTKIDYGKAAEEWMKPLVHGSDTGLMEIPANWYGTLTTCPRCKSRCSGVRNIGVSAAWFCLLCADCGTRMFIKAAPNSHGFVILGTFRIFGETTLTTFIGNMTTSSSS